MHRVRGAERTIMDLRYADLDPALHGLGVHLRQRCTSLFWSVREDRSAAVRAAGLALVGDAGQAMSPQLGQGADLALMDAAVLADALAAEPRLDAALERYTRARALHLRYYTYASWALNAVFQHDRTAMAWPRDHLIGPAARIPPLRRLMLRTLAGSFFSG